MSTKKSQDNVSISAKGQVTRVFMAYGIEDDHGNNPLLAEIFDVGPNTVSGWRTRGVPHDKLKAVSKEKGILLEWLKTGKGPMHDPRAGIREHDAEPVDYDPKPKLVSVSYTTAAKVSTQQTYKADTRVKIDWLREDLVELLDDWQALDADRQEEISAQIKTAAHKSRAKGGGGSNSAEGTSG